MAMAGDLLRLLLVILALWVAVILRMRRRFRQDSAELAGVSKGSAISRALEELAALAGGIYLALLMIVTFLGMELPEKTSFIGFSANPLALLSLVLALIQPMVLEVYQTIKLRR
jgi:formate-dependent nitrite reductase membrane component NrfD